MANITLGDVLDDLRTAEQALHKFEQRYWLSSEMFYELYMQGALDDGNHSEEFAEWAGHYVLKQKRDKALRQFSQQRIEALRQQAHGEYISLSPQEPVLEVA